MALQVWLPLNGNIKNYGVRGDIQFVGTSTDAIGKVTTTSQENKSNTTGGYVSDIQIDLGIKQSMFCWVNFNSFYATASLTGILGQHRYSSNQGMGLTAKYVSSSTGYLSINTGNGSSRTFVTYCGNTLLSSGKWYHVGYTYDGTTVTLYVNGNIDGTFTITDMKIVSDYIILFAWSLNGTSGSTYQANYRLNGKLNDVRLYDHCLSVKEVKNLAKGLMLHYTLSRPQANLLKNSFAEKSWSGSASAIKDSNYTQETITPNANSYYTMSFDAKSNIETTNKFVTYLYNNSSGRQCDEVKGYIDGELKFTGSASDGSCTLPTYTYYRHYVIVRHFNSNATALTKQNVFRLQSGSDGITMYVKNAKIELGNKATPWIPNSADTMYNQLGLNLNIEDDTSGYGNNGTRANITSRDTNTARYLTSSVFNGSNSYIRGLDPINSSATEFTISAWIYLNNVTSTMCLWNGRSSTSASVALFIMSTTMRFDDSNQTTASTNLTANNWIHVVGTWKSGGKKILYINGVEKSNVTAGTLSKSNVYGSIGLSSSADATPNSNPFNGKISDFRIYATALSADDVKELYNVGASIDKNGNMHCYELVES